MQTGPALERCADSAEERRALRQKLRRDAIACRMALGGDDYARRSQAVCRHLQANFPQLAAMRVGFCWPVNNEPDLRPALEAWLAAGNAAFAALLPVVVDAGAALAFREWRPGMAMEEDRHGIPTPAIGDFVQPQALHKSHRQQTGHRRGAGGQQNRQKHQRRVGCALLQAIHKNRHRQQGQRRGIQHQK